MTPASPTPLTANAFTLLGLIGLLLVATLILLCTLLARPTAAGARIRPVALASLFFAGIVLVLRVTFAGNTLDADERYWNRLGRAVCGTHCGDSAGTVATGVGKEGYTWLTGAMYSIFGPVPLVVILINYIALIGIVALLAHTAADIASLAGLGSHIERQASYIAAICAGLSPTILVWAPWLLRETISGFLVVAGVHFSVKYANTRNVGNLVYAGVAVAILATLRLPFALGLALGLAVGINASWTGEKMTLSRALIAGGSILAAPLALVYVDTLVGLDISDVMLRNEDLRTSATSGYEDAYATLGEEASYISILSVNLPRALLGPFPWELSMSPVMIMAAGEGLLWLAALAATFYTSRKTPQRQFALQGLLRTRMIIPVAAAASVIAMLSITGGNYGLLMRLRPLAYLALAPAAALGVSIALSRLSGHPKHSLSSITPEGPR